MRLLIIAAICVAVSACNGALIFGNNNNTTQTDDPTIPITIVLDPATMQRLFSTVAQVAAPTEAQAKSVQKVANDTKNSSLLTQASQCLRQLAQCKFVSSAEAQTQQAKKTDKTVEKDGTAAKSFPISGDYVAISHQINVSGLVDPAVLESDSNYTDWEFDVHLSSSDDFSVKGTMQLSDKKWNLQGFRQNLHLVFAFRGAPAEAHGFGTILLVDDDNGDGGQFVGLVDGMECGLNAVVRYPILLVKGTRGSKVVEDAKRKNASFLSQHGKLVNPSVCN